MFRHGLQKSAASEDPQCISEKVLRNAQNSGHLVLSNRELTSVPPVIWTLNTPLPPADKVVSFDASGDDARWWETQPIERLSLASNKLSKLDGQGLAQLDTLTILDLRDNLLTELPEEIEALSSLKQLVVASNQLTRLPPTIVKLSSLVWLDASHNKMTELPTGMEAMTAIERLNLQDCQLNSLPDRLPPKLGLLDVSKNRLTCLPCGLLQNSTHLREVDASENQLQDIGVPVDHTDFRNNCLTVLNLHQNRLAEFPNVSGFSKLKELTLGDNHIRGLALTRLGCNPELVTLDLARNSLSEIPVGLSNALPNLVRLDLSNNNLNSVPTELGFLESLHVLTLTANPIKSITSGVISSGTQAIKSLLRSRHVPPPDGRELNGDACGGNAKELVHLSEAGGNASTSPDAVVERLPGVTPSGLLDWSANNAGGGGARTMAGRGRLAGAQLRPPPPLPALNEVLAWQSAALPTASSNTSVREVRLVARQLDSFPLGLLAFESTLTSLNLSKNALRDLPSELTRFVRLEHLDLSSNLLQSLSSSLTALGTLQTLILDLNPSLGPELPAAVICQPPLSQSLQNLSARNCKLKRLPPASLLHPSNMPALQSLDVTDNDVDHLEPELGLCDQIKSLHLEGNAFRVPRPALVAKGTQAVLEYLRSRIVT
ncbi:hypothetical protein AAHC03_023022 [Spirometra sp. Aus1]